MKFTVVILTLFAVFVTISSGDEETKTEETTTTGNIQKYLQFL